MTRNGEVARVWSSRFQCTEDALAFALSVTKRRPPVVDAHIVPASCGARAIHETAPPARLPHAADVSCVEGTPSPMMTKSPQPGCVAEVVNSGQLASRNAWSPPQSWVRQTENEPWKIEPACAGFGSEMIGGEKREPSGVGGVGAGVVTPLCGSP